MGCPQHPLYISGAITSQGLESLTLSTLSDIQSCFSCNVQFGVPTASLTEIRFNLAGSNPDPSFLAIRNPRGGSRFIEKTNRAYVLNHEEWMINQRWTGGQTIIGRYLYAPATILLHLFESSNIVLWCRNTLIHEVLHSTSIYSTVWNDPPDIVAKHEPLNEGITEFLAGYVLFKKYPECYAIWKASTQGRCAIAYRERTKLFCSLAQVVGVGPIANFYFSTNTEFNGAWNKFVQEIRSLGFSKFNFALSKNQAFREAQFREECVKSISGFKKIYDSKIKVLDFSQVN